MAAETRAITPAPVSGGGMAGLIGKLKEFETAEPKGSGLTTVTAAEPEAAMSDAVISAVRTADD